MKDEELYKYYLDNMDELEDLWVEYVSQKEWGSGEDRIKINEAIFWEFVEDLFLKTQTELKSLLGDI